ncbi:hypothetical protein EDB87DRAFT_678913 [Lactarius vividus]|nr:hypothetical protein EDB87DRAFT_678913 [Lactarius vividus]
MEKLSTQVKEPLSELEYLVLLFMSSRHLFPSNLPFRWGSRLRVLHLTDISLPSLPLLLSSSPNLVNLQLHNLRISVFPSPVAFGNVLFRYDPTTRVTFTTFPSPHLFPGPTLAYLCHRGDALFFLLSPGLNSKALASALESLVAEIDAPCLGKINITFVNNVHSLSKLEKFINQIVSSEVT